ncbi:uncharacterized protein [Lolium perenne]|uniref:uncharacterized protein n=1 Tax=Lolium perenne TaxID=4522 RepID=UPI003A9953A8
MDAIAHSDILNKPITPEDAVDAEALEDKRLEMLATAKKFAQTAAAMIDERKEAANFVDNFLKREREVDESLVKVKQLQKHSEDKITEAQQEVDKIRRETIAPRKITFTTPTKQQPYATSKDNIKKMVEERRTFLYNQVVTSYHKAKIERAGLARELEAVKVEAAKVPQLESDLRAARAQCAESEEAGRSAAGKLKLAEQELTRLRLLEQNHLTELNSLRTAEKAKVDDLSRRLTEVEKQRLALQEEVTAKSTELTATAKRWTDDFSALDRGLAGEYIFMFLSLCRLSAVDCRLLLAADSRNF